MSISFLYAIWHSTLVRSQLTLDDVDFTVLVATSVLTDLISKCPPAEACRDAFTRMSKATISMVMGTTGFGNASTLGSQPLSSPGSYFRALSLTTTTQQHQQPGTEGLYAGAAESERGMVRQTKMPQFDMNLRDLFSDDELANHQPPEHPERQAYGSLPSRQAASGASSTPRLKTEPSTFSILSPQSTGSGASRYHQPPASAALPYTSPTHQQSSLQHFPGSLSHAQQPDYTFDDLSFLDSFDIAADQGNAWTGANDLFGTGGGGFDGNGAWEVSGGVDLFDGFWFGPQ